MIQLDGTRQPSLIANMRSARTDISMIYIPKAFRRAPEQSLRILQPLDTLQDTAEDYTKFDYDVFRNLAFASGNPVYGLILNSFGYNKSVVLMENSIKKGLKAQNFKSW